ncbi:hypothetical protein RAA17_14335 [Komagataeibacter rhaeticus]|nr:hypothetical protein [Komagataeibacter rhaeticus]
MAAGQPDPATTSISVTGTTATVSVAGGAVPSGTVGLRVGACPA